MKTKKILLISFVLLTFFGTALFAKEKILDSGIYTSKDTDYTINVINLYKNNYTILYRNSSGDVVLQTARERSKKNVINFTDYHSGTKVTILIISNKQFKDSVTGGIFTWNRAR